MRTAVLFALPALAVANPLLVNNPIFARDCNHDNCLRAVIASAYTTRDGTTDCQSFLKTTVTPATSTATGYTTLSFTPISTLDATSTSTIGLTSTTDVATVTVVSTPAVAGAVKPRQVTVATGTIPAYASACSSAARYSSACSCISVLPTTITAATPVTTITITVSATSTTSTLTTTVATVEFSTTDATASATATATVTVPQPFILQIQNPSDGQFDGWYLIETPNGMASDNSEYYRLDLGSDATAASAFYLEPGSTELLSSSHRGDFWCSHSPSPDYFVYVADQLAGTTLASPMTCSVGADLLVTCTQDATYARVGRCDGEVAVFTGDEGGSVPGVCGDVAYFDLLAVPLPTVTPV